MGCDIHLYVEKFINNKWVSLDKWVTENIGKEYEYTYVLNTKKFYSGRNYSLFSILAGVRGTIQPISLPKGLPLDISKKVKAKFDSCPDWHSESYFDLNELLIFDWNKEIKIDAWASLSDMEYDLYNVDYPQYRHFNLDAAKRNLIRNKWNFDDYYTIISFDQAIEEINRYSGCDNTHFLSLDKPEKIFPISYTAKIYEFAGDFYMKTIPKLRLLANNDPKSVRIVFWFDN